MIAPSSASGVPGNGNGNRNGPPFDIVRGGGEIPFVTPFGILNVTLQVDGMTKKGVTDGTFAAKITGIVNVEVSGRLTCLRVDGNEVVGSGVVDQSNSPLAPLGSGFIAMGLDNGDPVDGQPVDSALALPQNRPLTVCPRAISAGTPLVSGDFVTHDGGR